MIDVIGDLNSRRGPINPAPPPRISPRPCMPSCSCNNRTTQPIFLQNTLPLMIAILAAVGAATAAGWISNSNLSKRLDDIIKRLERIEYTLD